MFCLSVLGQPVTKKRARTGVGTAKDGHQFRWAVTPDQSYEEMIALAFQTKYSKALPIGYEFCDRRYYKKTDTYKYYVKKQYSDMDLPKLELIIIFYIQGGKVGDLDNYIKAIKDALNGLAFVDDRQFKHYVPYLISLDDPVYEDFLAHDEVALNNCDTLERVDFIIREFKPIPKQLVKLREFFEKDSVAIDYTTRYYNDFKQARVDELKQYAVDHNYDIGDAKLKADIVEALIQCELENGGYADGKISKRK